MYSTKSTSSLNQRKCFLLKLLDKLCMEGYSQHPCITKQSRNSNRKVLCEFVCCKKNQDNVSLAKKGKAT